MVALFMISLCLWICYDNYFNLLLCFVGKALKPTHVEKETEEIQKKEKVALEDTEI